MCQISIRLCHISRATVYKYIGLWKKRIGNHIGFPISCIHLLLITFPMMSKKVPVDDLRSASASSSEVSPYTSSTCSGVHTSPISSISSINALISFFFMRNTYPSVERLFSLHHLLHNHRHRLRWHNGRRCMSRHPNRPRNPSFCAADDHTGDTLHIYLP